MKIKNDSTVKLAYTLFFDDYDGDVFEVVTEEEPVEFKLGSGDMLEEFEKRILGLQAGDEFKFMINMDDGNSEEDEEAIVEMPLSMFEDVPREDLEPGNVIPLEDEEGNEFEALVIDIDEENITLDFNHPLAGEDLYLVGKILEVK